MGLKILFDQHFFCQSPDLAQGLEFDFTFAMEQEQEQQLEQPRLFQDGMVLEVWNVVHRLRKGVDLNFSRPKIFREQNFFRTKNFFGTKIFFGTKNFFGQPTFFWTKHFMGTKNF